MLDDLIRRQDAINALGERPMSWTDSDYELGQQNQYDLDKAHLELVPSAQPERKSGVWVSLDDFRGKYNENGFVCSECNEHSDYEENFCPNCGAMMVKGGGW